MKRHLKNTAYMEFVRDHVLRPYQTTLVGDQDKPLEFSRQHYDNIPEYVEKNPEWAERVFTRIAGIFKRIDADVFPRDCSSMVILLEAHKRGVAIKYT